MLVITVACKLFVLHVDGYLSSPVVSQIGELKHRWEQKRQVLNKYSIYFDASDSDDNNNKSDDALMSRENISSN